MIRIKYICDRWKLLLLALFPFSSFSQDLLNPIAENKSVVRSGNARFYRTYFSIDQARMEFRMGNLRMRLLLFSLTGNCLCRCLRKRKEKVSLLLPQRNLVLQFKIGIDSFSASNLSIRSTKTTPVSIFMDSSANGYA
jgi:hypothetical protein